MAMADAKFCVSTQELPLLNPNACLSRTRVKQWQEQEAQPPHSPEQRPLPTGETGEVFQTRSPLLKNGENQAAIFSEFENKKTFGGNTRGTGVQP